MNRLSRLATLLLLTSLMATGLSHLAATASQATATLEVTLRGCNEGVDPRVGNPATKCTTPLDAPDGAGAIWGGDGQGGMPFADMERHFDGTYEASIPANSDVQLQGMYPSLRNAYIVPELELEITAPFNNPPVVNAQPGETVALHFYYFYYPEASATMTILMRGCPEGFDPAADDFFDDCTTPLDAPEDATIVWGGDGQGGTEIALLDRESNGAYVYNAGTFTMNVDISGLAPVVRNAYQVFGYDAVQGETFTFNLQDGETREVFVFYHNDENGGGSTESGTIDITLRGCPEGVDPSTIADPAAACTIPLDAPETAGVIWGGDGQGGVELYLQDRLFDGTYHVTNVPSGVTIRLAGFEPTVRDSWFFTGDVSPTLNNDAELYVAPGGTYHVFVYYFNAA